MSEQAAAVPAPDPRTRLGKVLAVAGVILSAAFLLNVGMGVLFEIPDNLPIIGNLDEAAATALLLACLRYLGVDLLPFRRPR
jgi:hypothetical protein